MRGWLGRRKPESWIQAAHSETVIECHTKEGCHCAGVAIYRGNVGKLPRNEEVLALPKDKKTVFATPQEFLDHHTLKFRDLERPARLAVRPGKTPASSRPVRIRSKAGRHAVSGR